MTGFPILDLVIGMIFIYFLMSIVCSSAIELWFAICKTRARLLARWLNRIFNAAALNSNGEPLVDKKNKPVTLCAAIANHCMVTALSKTGKSTSYINAEDFVSALLDKVTITASTGKTEQAPPATLAAYLKAITDSTVISGDLKRTFLIYGNEAVQATAAINKLPAGATVTNIIDAGIKSDLDLFRQKLEDWYNRNTDRLTGTLKRTKSMPATFIFGAFITFGLNADSVSISRYLYNHTDQSSQLAAVAINTIGQYKDRVNSIRGNNDDSAHPPSNEKDIKHDVTQITNDIQQLTVALPAAIPIGWEEEMHRKGQDFPHTFISDFWEHAVGWLFTVLAICLGAPFWFDLLNKVANLRGTGPKPVVENDNKKK